MEHILALDIGSVRIGIAISDPLGIFAQGVGFLNAQDSWHEDLTLLIKKHNVKKVVIGLPIRTNGKKDREADAISDLTDKLKEKFPDITFILWDERFTTTLAQNYLRDSGMSGKKKRNKVDMIAATVLLQSYLDYSNLTKDIPS
ncbi:MAG: Holliday junction resolvase RuvX, partial [Acetomicrobium sp.]|nr:Holliday junction resolvase RuvX [Acetomicrobium sp.]